MVDDTQEREGSVDPEAGQRILSAYEGAGLNRNQFAKRIDAYYHQVLRWEAGHLPKPATLVKIAEATGVSIDFILRGESSVDREDEPESFKVWEKKLAPRDYDPAKHRRRLLRMGFRYPPSEAFKWTRAFELIVDEEQGAYSATPPSPAAVHEAEEKGYKKLPPKPPRKPKKGS